MEGLYRELVASHRRGELDLSQARTFNLDEYLGLPADDPRSFRAFMREHLFNEVNLDSDRIHLPDPLAARADPGGYGAAWERRIEAAGGIDLQLLGVGRNGHIAFNEPGSSASSRTRIVELARATREDAAPSFGGLEKTPRHAVTAGVATILEARALAVLVFGPHKAGALRAALEGPVGPDTPASFLRLHPNCRIWADREAAAELGETWNGA